MSISFGRRNKIPLSGMWASRAPARLVDLRSPEAFRAGFIPGSYNLPDRSCWLAARGSRLFNQREIYLLADHPEQLQLCEAFGDLGNGAELVGWFGPDALLECHKSAINLGEIEAICPDTLTIRLTVGNTLALAIVDSEDVQNNWSDHPSALRFCLSELPLSLDGLPVETAICVSASGEGIASFAASLLWNFGFHQISYVTRSLT